MAQTSLRVARAVVSPYALPLRAPWRTAGGEMSTRRGWLVRLECEGGLQGLGDCAPLPAAGTESMDEARLGLRATLGKLTGLEALEIVSALGEMGTTPAVRCGIETAALELVTRLEGRSLAEHLGSGPRREVHVNAMLGGIDETIQRRARSALANGFRVLKVKLGTAPMDHELRLLKGLAGELPTTASLRLDANRAYSMAEATNLVEGLRDLPVDSLEEPLSRPTPKALERLQASMDPPIALDETLVLGDMALWLDQPWLRRLILKPTALGGPLPTLELARLAESQARQIVITSALESAVGLHMAMQLAIAVDSGQSHGLSTGLWFARDVAVCPQPIRGRMRRGSSPGLGDLQLRRLRFHSVHEL